MRLDIELWRKSETHRHYMTESLQLSTKSSPISWLSGNTPEVQDLTEQEENLAVGIFSVGAIKAATLWPKGIEIEVEEPDAWNEVEPAVVALLGQAAGADEINVFLSPQDPNQY